MQQRCEKCKRVMDQSDFYRSNNLEKYPNEGLLNLCKKCATMHIDNWDSKTFLWLLQEIDIPWIPEEWDKLMEKFGRDPTKITGLTIIGRYISKMKLKQFKDYRWKDTEFLAQMAEKKLRDTMTAQGYSAAEITEAVEEKKVKEIDPNVQQPVPDFSSVPEGITVKDSPIAPTMDYFSQPEVDLGLTEEETQYLRLKWGNTYKPSEWVQLEQLYQEMMKSYDIQTAGHKDTLKLICKTSLKANQLIDYGDVEGYQKMSKVYDSLMKSGRFTAAQNKEEQGEFVDSVSELVSMCEKEGFIPRYYIDEPKDKVDEVLKDSKEYLRTLVTEELGLANLIENAVKSMKIEEEKEEAIDEEDPQSLDDVAESIDSQLTFTDDDYVERNELIEQEQIIDAEREAEDSGS